MMALFGGHVVAHGGHMVVLIGGHVVAYWWTCCGSLVDIWWLLLVDM